jgi:hypothetical protein
MFGTVLNFEPTDRAFVYIAEDETGRPFRRRPGRGNVRRRAINASLRGAR